MKKAIHAIASSSRVAPLSRRFCANKFQLKGRKDVDSHGNVPLLKSILVFCHEVEKTSRGRLKAAHIQRLEVVKNTQE